VSSPPILLAGSQQSYARNPTAFARGSLLRTEGVTFSGACRPPFWNSGVEQRGLLAAALSKGKN
jgi:hypothetical protein